MTLLTAFVFNEKPCLDGHGGGVVNEPLKIEDTPSFGYIDVSSITNWYEEGFGLNYDYSFVRDEILNLTTRTAIATTRGTENDPSSISDPKEGDRYLVGANPVGDFAGHSGQIACYSGANWDYYFPEILGYKDANKQEREYLAKVYIGLISDHNRDFGKEVTQAWRDEYHFQSGQARTGRIRRAETLLERELKPQLGFIMLTITSLVTELDLGFGNQLYSIDLHKNFKQFGVRGTVEDYDPVKNPTPPVGLMDFVYGRALFTGKGLINMPFQPASFSNIQSICDRLNEILVLGLIQ